MLETIALERLKKALCALPGVGPKTAQRMAFHLVGRDREGARALSEAITGALQSIRRCKRCNNFSETELCPVCSSPKRNAAQLCVVETQADLESIEMSKAFSGTYFVLMGHLSPLDGIGPEELGLDRLQRLLDEEDIEEVVMATNPTVEGDATADFIAQLVRQHGIRVTQLARGVPVGGELEYVDRNTLAGAFRGRKDL
ncbi:MAG: recombination protein RecR [Gammaproteobacteria bacterium]|nr:MAG: recombination protein RecR [Gammaproteobacteria bacterium]